MFKLFVFIISLPLYILKFVGYIFPTVFKIIYGAFEVAFTDKTLDQVNEDIIEFWKGFR